MVNKFFSIKNVPGNTGIKVRKVKTRTNPFENYDAGPPGCEKCELFKGCLNPYLKHTGLGKKKILVIGEMPTLDEDDAGERCTTDRTGIRLHCAPS